MNNTPFRFFSYSYGNDLATPKVLFWLISMNILSLLIAVIEFYAYTDAARNHISAAAGVYIGLVTGIVLWVFDQSIIATDTAEFERLGKTRTLNASMVVRAAVFIVSIAATSYFLTAYLSRQDAALEIDKHNQGEIIKINRFLQQQAAQRNAAEERAFHANKARIEGEASQLLAEMEGHKQALAKKKTGHLKDRKGRYIRQNGQLVAVESCKLNNQAVACDEIRQQLVNAQSRLERLGQDLARHQQPFTPTVQPQLLTLSHPDQISGIKERHCLEIDCDFWFLTKTEDRNKALQRIDTRESWILSAVVMGILATAFLMFKVLQPEEVKHYYDAALQSQFGRYKNGLFDDIIDAQEHYRNNPMDSGRFKQWLAQYDPGDHEAYKRYLQGAFDDILDNSQHCHGPSRLSFAAFRAWYGAYDQTLHQKYAHDYRQGLLDDYILEENEHHGAAAPMDFQRFKDWHANEYPSLKKDHERVKKVRQLRAEIKSLAIAVADGGQAAAQKLAQLTSWQQEAEALTLELADHQVRIQELAHSIDETQAHIDALTG